MKNIGRNLNIFRTKRGLTQQEVADYLHIDRRTLSYYENGRNVPNDLITSFAELYGVSVSDIYHGNEETEGFMTELERLSAKHLRRSFPEMIAGSKLWKEYQRNLSKNEGEYAEHKDDPEWAFINDIQRDYERYQGFGEISELVEGNAFEDALEKCEEMLSKGYSDYLLCATKLLEQVDEMDHVGKVPEKLEAMEDTLERIEKVAVYSAIAHSALTRELEETFSYFTGGGNDERK